MASFPAAPAFCLLAAVAASIATATSMGTTARLPHLNDDARQTNFLESNEPWKPSQIILITALMTGRPLQVQTVAVQAQNPITPDGCHLLYKCSTGNSTFKEVNVRAPSTGGNLVHCQHARPFTLTVSDSQLCWFNLTLYGNTEIDFDQALVHSMELRVRVTFPAGSLESHSLFVFNFDALTKLNAAPVERRGTKLIPYILSSDGLEFLTTLHPPSRGNIQKLQLLDQKFVAAVNRAPLYLRSMIHVTVTIRGNARCDDPSSGIIVTIITTGDPTEKIKNYLVGESVFVLSLHNGQLHFYTHSAFQLRMSLISGMLTMPMQICIRISVNSPVWDYQLMLPVTEMLNVRYSIGSSSVAKSFCYLPDGRRYMWKIITEGSRNVLLVNPILCYRGTSQLNDVFFNERKCFNFISQTRRDWQSCGHYYISRRGSAVWLDAPTAQRHSGIYKFSVRNLTFFYVVTVIALPVFNTAALSGALPEVTYANLDTRVNFNCSVFHDGMRHVAIVPKFRVLELFGNPKWRELNVIDFAIQVLKRAPSSVRQTNYRTGYSNGLLVQMPPVNEHWRTWVLVFTCEAFVLVEDIQKIGLPYYSISSSTDVVYFGNRMQRRNSKDCVRHSNWVATPLLLVALAVSLVS